VNAIPITGHTYYLYYNKTNISNPFTTIPLYILASSINNKQNSYNTGWSYSACDNSGNYYYGSNNNPGYIGIYNSSYPNGTVYYTDLNNQMVTGYITYYNNKIYYGSTYFTTSGYGIKFISCGNTPNTFNTTNNPRITVSGNTDPNGQYVKTICFDNSNNMFCTLTGSNSTYTTYSNYNLYKIDNSYVCSIFSTLPIKDVIQIACDSYNNIYALSEQTKVIYKINTSGTYSIYYQWTKYEKGTSIMIDPSNNIFLVTGTTNLNNAYLLINITNPSGVVEIINNTTFSNLSSNGLVITLCYNPFKKVIGIVFINGANTPIVIIAEFNPYTMTFTNVTYDVSGSNSTRIIDANNGKITTSFDVNVE